MNYRLFWLVVLTALWGCENDGLEVNDVRDMEVPEGFVLSAGTSTIFKNSSYAYDTDADFIVGKDYHFDAERQLGHTSIQPPRLTMMHFFVATLDHQSSFIKRSLFDGSPYREDYRLVSDWIFFTEKIVKEEKQVRFIPDIVCRREEGGLSEQQRERNRKEINKYLHQLLPAGIYEDYATLSKLDKTSLYRLFDICNNERKRKAIIWCIKIINRIFS